MEWLSDGVPKAPYLHSEMAKPFSEWKLIAIVNFIISAEFKPTDEEN